MNDLEKYFTPYAIEQMKKNNVSLKKMGARLSIGKSLDEAFAFNNRGRKTIYPNWAFQKAKENGISRQLLYERVKVRGMSIEEAVSMPVGRNRTCLK